MYIRYIQSMYKDRQREREREVKNYRNNLLFCFLNEKDLVIKKSYPCLKVFKVLCMQKKTFFIFRFKRKLRCFYGYACLGLNQTKILHYSNSTTQSQNPRRFKKVGNWKCTPRKKTLIESIDKILCISDSTEGTRSRYRFESVKMQFTINPTVFFF